MVDAADSEPTKPRRRLGRRARLTLLIVAMMLITTAAVPLVVHWWRPHYRPSLHAGESYGIDVSHYQGSIDWPKVAADGIDFAYLKSTEAGDWVDETFATNWEGARAAGLDVGAYHFFTFFRTGADQAANFLRVVPDGERWTFWQCSDVAQVDGIDGAVDLDVRR